MVEKKLHPYIILLPAKAKINILKSIFSSEVPTRILEFSTTKGVSAKIYQKELVEELPYSNKTVIEHLKKLTNLEILIENMEKKHDRNRNVWVKYYLLSEVGKWFALLLAEEKLSKEEKSQILSNVFRAYIRWVKELSEKLHISKDALRRIFNEEMQTHSKTKTREHL